MLGKLLVSASFAALLLVAPAAAQESQGQGAGGQTQPILPQDQNAPPQGENAGQATGAQQQPDQNQATGNATGNEGQMTNQNTENAQQPAAEQPAAEDQATGEQGGAAKTKRKNTQQTQQDDQPAAEDQATGEQSGTAKTKKTQQTQQDNEPATTGTTSKAAAEIPAEKRTVIRDRIISKKVTRVERDNIDFDINVGIAVPSTISLYPLPPDIIEVVPAYRGYSYFVLADGTIIIVEPSTHHIVYVLAG